MYTMVWYGNSPLNSASLLAHKQILQISTFAASRTLHYHSVHTVFMLNLKLNWFTLHGYQVLQDTPCLYKIPAYQKKA